MKKERREEARRLCNMTVALKEGKTEKVIPEGITNISRGGIYVNTHNPLEVGSKFALEFHVPKPEKDVKCEGMVVWGYHPDPPSRGKGHARNGDKADESGMR